MKQRSIRGAITIAFDTKDNVLSATKELLNEVIKLNNIDLEEIVNIIFTTTPDIKSVFPPVAARQIGLNDVPLLTCQEIDCENGLKLCIRIMLTFNTEKTQKQIQHIYLKDAIKLRPDLKIKE